MPAGMIMIDVELATSAEQRSAMLDLLKNTVAGSMAEPGCVIYRATAAIDDPLRFHLLELWESEAAYAAHRQGAPLATFLKELPACGRVVSIDRRAGPLAAYEAA